MFKIIRFFVFVFILVEPIYGAPVSLQNPTATFSQSGYVIGESINGDYSNSAGWAIAGTSTDPQTAVFELVTPLSSSHGYHVEIEIHQIYGAVGKHTIGRFRISVTSDSQSTFADGLSSGGDVTATWTVLEFDSLAATNGVVLTTLTDGSILASSADPSTTVYTVSGDFVSSGSLTEVTGIRLEVLADTSFPYDGPGRYPPNGNFVLGEFVADFTELPPSFVINNDLDVVGDIDFTGTFYQNGVEVYFGGGPNFWSSSGSDLEYTVGNVGIGTSAVSGYKLAVNGSVRAREVLVDAAVWADNVFYPEYELAALSEVDAFIQARGHLPGMPSEADVRENGVGLAGMQVNLLRKIEELTLHLIEQERRITALENENEELRKH